VSFDLAQIRFGDGTVFYARYDTVSDVPGPSFFPSREALVDDVGRLDYQQRDCTRHEIEPVLIATSYGTEFWWEGTACRECSTLEDGMDPFDGVVERNRGLPSWWVQGVDIWTMLRKAGL